MAEAAQAELTTPEKKWRADRKWRRNSGAERSLTLLLTRPVITRKSLSDMLEISEPSAGEAIVQLASAKVVKERTGHKRNRVFYAPDVLKIFNRSPQSDVAH